MALSFLHGADAAEILEADHFSANEAASQVGMDLARAVHGVGTFGNGPGPAFILPHGEENNLVHGVEDLPQDFLAGKAGHVQVLHERLAIFLGGAL